MHSVCLSEHPSTYRHRSNPTSATVASTTITSTTAPLAATFLGTATAATLATETVASAAADWTTTDSAIVTSITVAAATIAPTAASMIVDLLWATLDPLS